MVLVLAAARLLCTANAHLVRSTSACGSKPIGRRIAYADKEVPAFPLVQDHSPTGPISYGSRVLGSGYACVRNAFLFDGLETAGSTYSVHTFPLVPRYDRYSYAGLRHAPVAKMLRYTRLQSTGVSTP